MKILLFDNDNTNVSEFNKVTTEMIRTCLENYSSHNTLISRFLERNEPLELLGEQVNSYAGLEKELANTELIVKPGSEAPPSPTVLLLDCEIEPPSSYKGILPIINKLKRHKDLIIVLATSYDTGILDSDISSYIKTYIAPKPSKACKGEANVLANICYGIEHWEFLQGSPYEAFFKELFLGQNTRPYTLHPPAGDNYRLDALKKHFPILETRSQMIKFMNRQIFEIAAFNRSDGVGVEGACFLSLLKASELFPGEYESVFGTVDWASIPVIRSQRSKDRPFMPPQERDDRSNSILAFGEACDKHFVFKDEEKKEKKRAIRSIALSFNTESSAGSLTWELHWKETYADYPKNIREAYAYMLAHLKGESRARPIHDASNALVEFFISTTQAIPVNDRDYLRGTCINVAFNVAKSRCQVIFKD